MSEDILINVTPQETRVAIMQSGVVQELHIERAAKWSQERPSQALPGRSSGSTAHLHPEALADCVLPTPLPLPPKPPNSPQRVVVPVRPPLPRGQVQSVAGVRHNKYQDTHAENDDPKRALHYIIANAMKGVEAKRWVSSDIAQPNTVELWVRIFQGPHVSQRDHAR